MSDSMREKIRKAVNEYTGKDCAIQIFPDPKVRGVYGVRALAHRSKKVVIQMDFIYHADGELEDAEFDQWPPKSGPLQFFI